MRHQQNRWPVREGTRRYAAVPARLSYITRVGSSLGSIFYTVLLRLRTAVRGMFMIIPEGLVLV